MYRAPISEIAFMMKHVAGLPELLQSNRFSDLSEDLVDAILTEAARFSEEEIAPLNRVGDQQGSTLADGVVTVPDGWTECYRNWSEAGWNALTGDPDYGGQGLPVSLFMATMEIWNAGSVAFGLCPTLTVGAIEALEEHATPALKDVYLAKMITGEWTGTMNLTEPQAGSDLNALRSRAEPQADGSYRLFGQKIFITYGEHGMTENIIHLVLARLPDAPAGTRGISLFLVPKYLVDEEGNPGQRNDLKCSGIEHKLGIHASPTCMMSFGDNEGAVGYLVGEENKGLACMFTMMNNARLAVGVQGLGVAERATQQAMAYAKERKQGRAVGAEGPGMSPIAAHPDIKRSLLSMMALTSVARVLCFVCAHAIDMSRTGEDDAFWSDRAAFLTPFAKALSTDIAVEVASTGVQIHGGMGFVEETGAAQHFRDARILPIYEGTNGIQAIDLVMRKIPLAGGEHVAGFIKELRDIVSDVGAANNPELGTMAGCLDEALNDVEEATAFINDAHGEGRTNDILAGATPYLRLFGLATGGCLLAKGAMATLRQAATSNDDNNRLLVARYFSENLLAETKGLCRTVTRGAESTLAFDSFSVAS
ncbi:MAG: acyl-CoA dehydrogenase [Stappiaceae bacterium]